MNYSGIETLTAGSIIFWDSYKHNQDVVDVACACGTIRRDVQINNLRTARYPGLCHPCATSYGRSKNPDFWTPWEPVLRKDGYVTERVSTNDPYWNMGYAGKILQHRLVMARHLGRSLERWEHVHHKNGVKSDNRLQNLELITPPDHAALTALESEIKRLRLKVAKSLSCPHCRLHTSFWDESNELI